jgi:hypothetical protein
MERDYDIFERPSLGSPIWRACVSGLWKMHAKLEEVAAKTSNECFAIHLPTKEIVASTSGREASPLRPKRLVFQVAYDSETAIERAGLLRLCGYEVVSVIGNEAAKVILNMPQPWDLFIVGGRITEETEEIVRWLKARFPGIPVLALNGPGIRDLPVADYNIKANEPDEWLTAVVAALGPA